MPGEMSDIKRGDRVVVQTADGQEIRGVAMTGQGAWINVAVFGATQSEILSFEAQRVRLEQVSRWAAFTDDELASVLRGAAALITARCGLNDDDKEICRGVKAEIERRKA